MIQSYTLKPGPIERTVDDARKNGFAAYRCVECTLLRCHQANTTCAECQSNKPKIDTPVARLIGLQEEPSTIPEHWDEGYCGG